MKVRDDYRMDYDEDRGGLGGGTSRQLQRKGVDTSSFTSGGDNSRTMEK